MPEGKLPQVKTENIGPGVLIRRVQVNSYRDSTGTAVSFQLKRPRRIGRSRGRSERIARRLASVAAFRCGKGRWRGFLTLRRCCEGTEYRLLSTFPDPHRCLLRASQGCRLRVDKALNAFVPPTVLAVTQLAPVGGIEVVGSPRVPVTIKRYCT